MARPIKEGLDYLPLDCVMDAKVELLESECGIQGFAYYIKLLQEIYQTSNGELQMIIGDGFSRWKTLGKRWNIPADELRNLVVVMVAIGLFDKDAFETGILTSKGIKKRINEINFMREKDRHRKRCDIPHGKHGFSSGFPTDNANKRKGKESINKAGARAPVENSKISPKALKNDVEDLKNLGWDLPKIKDHLLNARNIPEVEVDQALGKAF